MLLKEVCGLFPSGRFHIGGDEAPKNEWEECPDCRKRMENERHLTADDLQGISQIALPEPEEIQ